MPPAPIVFGIAGWSYPDWAGYVYPPGTRDPLAYIAGYVDGIEINSTFYRPPSARDAASWHRRTERFPGFFFTAKLHQDITHGGRLDPGMVTRFREGLKPLVEAGRLTHLLAQFRYDVADTPEVRAHLQRIRDAFTGMATLTLELRHISWQAPDALAYAAGLGVSVATLDYPLAQNSFQLRLCEVGAHRYFRLHGRNAQAWFDRQAGRDETYNYYYPAAEREELARRATDLAARAQSLTVIGNNHFQGQQVANVLQLKTLITGQKVKVPPGLLRHYPELASIALNAGEEWPLL